MLMICEYCNQVVEIAEMNSHLLSECKESSHFKECPKCKSSILKDLLKDHIKSNSCKPLRVDLGIIRCPLCEKDLAIDADNPDKCWREHLVIKGCP